MPLESVWLAQYTSEYCYRKYLEFNVKYDGCYESELKYQYFAQAGVWLGRAIHRLAEERGVSCS